MTDQPTDARRTFGDIAPTRAEPPDATIFGATIAAEVPREALRDA